MDVIDGYLRRGIRTVDGWLQPEAAYLIAQLARSQEVRGAVGEIGIHHGKLFILLSLCRRPDEPGVAIDLFEEQDKNVDQSGAGDRDIFSANLDRIDPRAATVLVHGADSTTLSAEELVNLAGQRYRLFSVDGGHTSDITINDLEITTHALAPGGIVILDDYFNEAWPGVSEGTNRFLMDNPSVVPFAAGYGKTFFTHETAVERYRGVVVAVAEAHRWRITEQPFHGTRLTIVANGPTLTRRVIASIRSTETGRRLTDPIRTAVAPYRRSKAQ